MGRRYDLALFGATGFTGGLVAEYLADRLEPSRWALAGRDRAKLEAVRAGLAADREDPALERLGLVVADARAPATLRAMAEDARVVLTTVGPFSAHGEPLVAACVAAGTDYVDITGEPGYWRGLIDRYHAEAVKRGVLVVPCCGFDSIPHDLGVMFAVSHLKPQGPVRAQGYVAAFGDFSGGTWASALDILSTQQLRRLWPRGRSPGRGRSRSGPGRPPRTIHYSEEVHRWVTPLPTIDPLVVQRSAAMLTDRYGESFTYDHYFEAKDKWQLAGAVVGAGGLWLGSKIPAVRRRIAATRPPGTGPGDAARARHWFRVHVVARDDAQVVRAEVRGGDPGYGETAKMVAESALCLVDDRAQLPARGGVLTPASALGELLLERLRAAGIQFSLVDHALDPRPHHQRDPSRATAR